jgi:hypothetical protein
MNLTGRVARLAAAATAASALAVIPVGSPAQAAIYYVDVVRPGGGNGTVHYRIEYGASIVDGNVTFTDRSVSISGSIKAVSSSRTALFVPTNPNGSCAPDETRTSPVNTTTRFGPIVENCPVPGGFSVVTVFFPI